MIVGCASGIGAAGARLLAADGWRLALIDIARERLREIGTELGAATTIVADASDPAALGQALDQAISSLGTLTAAWSNAGVQTNGDVEQATVDDLDRCYAVNLRRHFVIAKHAPGFCSRLPRLT